MKLLMRTDPLGRWLVISIIAALGIAITWFGFHHLSSTAVLFGAWLGTSLTILALQRLPHTMPAWWDGVSVLAMGLGPLAFPVWRGPIESFARNALHVAQGVIRFF